MTIDDNQTIDLVLRRHHTLARFEPNCREVNRRPLLDVLEELPSQQFDQRFYSRVGREHFVLGGVSMLGGLKLDAVMERVVRIFESCLIS